MTAEFTEIKVLERELGRIDADLADLAIDMYNDYRWLDVADPLAVDVGGSPRWQHIKRLEQGRMELWHTIEMWHRDHPDDSARIEAQRGPDGKPPSLADEVARLRELAGIR